VHIFVKKTDQRLQNCDCKKLMMQAAVICIVSVAVQQPSKVKFESKFTAAKKVLKKQLKVNTKVVFDDDGLVRFIYTDLFI